MVYAAYVWYTVNKVVSYSVVRKVYYLGGYNHIDIWHDSGTGSSVRYRYLQNFCIAANLAS